MKKKKIKRLPTYDGQTFMVDNDKFFPLIKSIGDRFGYHLDRDDYVVSNYKKNGKTITVKVHRLIMRLRGYKIKGLIIDHKDRNRLNNTKKNLRVVGYRYSNRNRNIVVNY